MIEDGLCGLLTADPSLSGLIGTRCYPLNLPETPIAPAITLRVVSTTEDYTLDGATGMVQVRVQLDAWGSTYAQSRNVAAQTRTLLNSYTGTLPNGTNVLDITRDGEQTGFDEYARWYYTQTDWIVVFEQQ